MFKGDKNLRQLEIIYEKCGSPDELIWPGVKSYRFYDDFGPKKYYPRILKNIMKTKNPEFCDELALDLLDKLLTLCPNQRLTATEALNHAYFSSEPNSCQILDMPKFEKEELHGPIRQNTNNNRNINHNQEKEDLKKYETIYKKIKK